MAGGGKTNGNGDRPPVPTEDKLLRRLRVISGAVMLALVAFLILIDAIGRLFIDPSFRVSEIFLGSLLGALMLLVGIEVASRFPFSGGGSK